MFHLCEGIMRNEYAIVKAVWDLRSRHKSGYNRGLRIPHTQ